MKQVLKSRPVEIEVKTTCQRNRKMAEILLIGAAYIEMSDRLKTIGLGGSVTDERTPIIRVKLSAFVRADSTLITGWCDYSATATVTCEWVNIG